VSFLTVLVVSIRITCATQRNLCDFINLTIFFFPISFLNISRVVKQYSPTGRRNHGRPLKRLPDA